MAEQSEPRERRESVQRIQIGLIGLCAVLLIVAFANLVVKTMRPDGSLPLAAGGQGPAGAGSVNATAGDTEPFADLGVTPVTDSSVGPSVPDLEPDPRLSKPMDRDPNKPANGQRQR